MKLVLTLLAIVMLGSAGMLVSGTTARADGADSDSRGLKMLLEERRKGKILPLFAILRLVNDVTGDDIVEIEFERENGEVKYGIYFLTPEGLRREIYVDAQTGEILEEKAADEKVPEE